MRRYLHPVLATAVLTATLSSGSPAAAGAPDKGAVSVLAWNETAIGTIASVGAPPLEVPPVAAIPPPVQPIYLAYVHRAVHAAVERAIDEKASVPAAVAEAAHDVLDAHFPREPQQEIIEPAYETALAAVPDGARKTRGIAIGQAAATDLLDQREDDGLAEGLAGPPLPLPKYKPGVWTPAPGFTAAATSYLGSVEPFVLRSAAQFRPGKPPALGSLRYTRDFEEVRIHGSATNPETTEKDTGWFWAEPPGVQSQSALRLHAEDLDGLAAARLFALTNTASADALIACADAKFKYNFWRPFTAIPRAAEDRNDATVADPGWTPLAPTPNFPEYPSNHSCTTTAVVTVLDALDGGSQFSLTFDSYRGGTTVYETRTFDSAGEVIADVADGRVFGGMHFRFSTTVGEEIGRSVAAAVLRSDP
jgi:PAP2 superfamily